MARIKGAMMTRKRRNKTLKLAKGYWGSKSKHFKMAKQAVMKSGNYAFAGRKQKKRSYRTLWITRLSAAVAPYGLNCPRWPFRTPLRSPPSWRRPRPLCNQSFFFLPAPEIRQGGFFMPVEKTSGVALAPLCRGSCHGPQARD